MIVITDPCLKLDTMPPAVSTGDRLKIVRDHFRPFFLTDAAGSRAGVEVGDLFVCIKDRGAFFAPFFPTVAGAFAPRARGADGSETLVTKSD